jgi:D-alanyl-D-alanine carboxypeptidase/D-alanyl-D-alanine-endopeptidase (penicillin-binding protein 4)
MSKIICGLLCVFCLCCRASATPLPPSVRDALRQAHIPQEDIGVEVREVNAGKPLISINAARPMNPASTMKLLTTYAGLELLGPAYTWKTEALQDGTLQDGVLQGDLVFKGYGDPKFTIEQFWLWLSELRGRGLREIRGNVLIDSSAFDLPPYDPAVFDNDPVRAYNVGPDALLLNFNAVNLHFMPQGGKVGVYAEPQLAGYTLDNRLTLAMVSECDGGWNDAIRPQLQGTALLLQGSFPAACGERQEYLSLLPHDAYFDAVFRALWQELGGTLSGQVRAGKASKGAVLFAAHNSAPLSDLIRDINKFSNNVMARQLFLSLSLDATTPASVARSEQAIRGWLAQMQLDFPELVLENGAGLSRRERISAHSMARLLQAANHSPLQAEFEASLPIAGVDGTLKKRFRDGGAGSHAHLKTGSLEGVKAIAGYVQSQGGKQWIMVFFINHPNAAAGQRAEDALADWLQQRR